MKRYKILNNLYLNKKRVRFFGALLYELRDNRPRLSPHKEPT